MGSSARSSGRARRCSRGFLALLTSALALAFLAEDAFAKPPRRVPRRLVSIGDSITTATNAEEFDPFDPITENPWASWVNGYASSGHTNVRSHNQRITRKFGARRRANIMAAKQGADSGDLLDQARIAVDQRADYVTILLGANDVCADDFSDIPTDAEFEANIREGFRKLRRGLRDGATVYTLGIIDIYRLWQVGDELTAFGTIDCELIWETTTQGIFPCATMLSPNNSEADRLRTRDRIVAFNDILRRVSAEMEADDQRHYWNFSNVSFRLDWNAEHVSEFDCFHPSAEGQRLLARETWRAGPFR